MDAFAAPDVERLLEHEGLVRRVVHAVLHGDVREDDAVQDTWATALERGPRDPRSLGAWLASVGRRFALTTRRRDRSRGRIESSRVGPRVPTPDEVLVREEERRRVLDALLRLSPVHRDVLLLRFYEGLPPRAMAERLGVPAETVRTRVKRALAALRAALAPADRRRLALAAGAPGARETEGATVALAIGGLMAAKSLAVAATVLALLGAGAWWIATRPPVDAPVATAPPSERSAAAPAALAGDGRAARARAAPDGAPSTPSPDRGEPADARPTVRVRLVDVDPARAAGAKVEVTGIGDWDRQPTAVVRAQQATDAVFTADVSPLLEPAAPALELVVAVDHPDFVPTQVRTSLPPRAKPGSPPIRDVSVRLVTAGVVDGRVVDARGNPLAKANALVCEVPAADASTVRVVEAVLTREDGTFRVRIGAESEYLVVAEREGLRPAFVRRRLAPGDRVDVGDLALLGGATLAGEVRGPSDARFALEVALAVEGAELTIPSDGDEPTLAWDGSRLRRKVVTVAVDEGRFVATGLEAGPATLEVRSRGPEDLFVHQELAEDLRRDVVVPASDVVVEVVGARLVVAVEGDDRALERARVHVKGDEGIVTRSTDARGLAAILVRPTAAHDVWVDAEGWRPAGRRVVAPGAREERVERFVLVRAEAATRADVGSVRLRLALPARAAASHASIRLVDADGGQDSSEDRDVAVPPSGEIVLDDVSPGRRRLLARVGDRFFGGGDGLFLPAESVVDVRSGQVTVVDLPILPGGRLRVAARGADGSFLAADCRLLSGENVVSTGFLVRHVGGLQVGPALSTSGPGISQPALSSGRYRVELSHAGYRTKVVEASVVAGEVVDVDVTLDRE
jgi:RNA polymerase sigma factor (sigma-70 family)